MQGEGLFNDDQEQFLAELMDKAIKFKNPILEGIDRSVFKLLINVIDNNLVERLPDEEWEHPLKPIVDAAIEKRWDDVEVLVADLLDEKIDIPGIDDDAENLIFDYAIKFIATLIHNYATKKQAEEENQ